MGGRLRFEVWTQPTSATFEKRFDIDSALPGSTGVVELSAFTDCQCLVPAMWDRIDQVVSDTEGSLISVYDGDTWVDDFLAERVAKPQRRPSIRAITGRQINGIIEGLAIYPYRYPEHHPEAMDWIWAGENVMPDLDLASLGSTRATYELFLSGERYTLDLALASAGTFTLNVGGDTDPIDFDPTASGIKSALKDLAAVTEVDVVDHEDGSFTIDFRTPKNLATDMTADFSGLTGSGTLTKDADGFDTGSDPTFTIDVGGDTTEALDWDASHNELEGSSETLSPPGSGLQGLSTVTDVTVSGSGVFSDPWEITFYDPPDPASVNVSFVAGQAIITRTVVGALDPSPITKSKPVDQGAGSEEEYGSYLNPPIQVVTDPTFLDTDADWALRVNAQSRYAGSQVLVNVDPGMEYGTVSIRVRPEVAGTYTLVLRTLAGDKIINTTPRDVQLSAGSYQTLEISDVIIPDGHEQIIMRVAVTDPNPGDIGTFYVNWQGAQFIEGQPAARATRILRQLVEAAQDRGAFEFLELDWASDDLTDTGGNALDEISFAAWFGADANLSQPLDNLHDLGYEWRIVRKPTPSGGKTHLLQLWGPGNAGTDHTASAGGPSVTVGSGLRDAETVKRIPPFTTLLGHGPGGLVHEDTNATTEANLGRIERVVDAEHLANEDAIQLLLDAKFSEEARNREALSATVLGSNQSVPLLDYQPGDTIWWQYPGAVEKHARPVRRVGWTHGVPASYQVQGSRILTGEAGIATAVAKLLREFRRRREQKRKRVTAGTQQTGGAVGAHIHLTRASAQSIPSGTASAIEWSALGALDPRNFATPPFDSADVVIQEPGYYDIKVDLGFDEVTGAAVSVSRERSGSESTIWPLAEDPGIWDVAYQTALFTDTVKGVECLAGDIIRVYFEQSSGSAVDLTGVLSVELVDRTQVAKLATPDIQAYAQDGHGGSPYELNFTLPAAPAEGDVLVLLIACQASSVSTVSGTGWDELADEAPGGSRRFYVFSKDCAADESDTVDVGINDEGLLDNFWGVLIHVTGAAYPQFDYDHNQGADGEGDIAPSVSSSANGLLLCLWQASHGFGDIPEGLQEMVTANTAGGVHYQVGYRQTTGGSTENYEADVDVEDATGMGMQLAFAPRAT